MSELHIPIKKKTERDEVGEVDVNWEDEKGRYVLCHASASRIWALGKRRKATLVLSTEPAPGAWEGVTTRLCSYVRLLGLGPKARARLCDLDDETMIHAGLAVSLRDLLGHHHDPDDGWPPGTPFWFWIEL